MAGIVFTAVDERRFYAQCDIGSFDFTVSADVRQSTMAFVTAACVAALFSIFTIALRAFIDILTETRFDTPLTRFTRA